MKRSGFKKKSFSEYKPMKRTPLRTISPNKVIKKKKTSIYKWTPPKWIGPIPQGSHGSTSIQKKLWKVVSDFVRIKDFYLHGSICFGCLEHKIHNWKDGQAGHWKSWGYSNSYAKYEIRNLLMICANCNNNEDGLIGHRVGQQLIKMYGKNNEAYIVEQNNIYRGKKMEEIVLVGMIEMFINKMSELPEQPEYWNKVMSKLDEHNEMLSNDKMHS